MYWSFSPVLVFISKFIYVHFQCVRLCISVVNKSYVLQHCLRIPVCTCSNNSVPFQAYITFLKGPEYEKEKRRGRSCTDDK